MSFIGFNLSNISSAYVGNTLVRQIYFGSSLLWPSHDYSQDYLTLEALEPTIFTFSTNDLQYSLDDGATWTTLTAGSSTPIINTGNKILWKQTGLTPTTNVGIGTFSATGNFKAYGNVMSLYYGDNFVGETDLTGKEYAFCRLFYQKNTITDAANLVLPTTTLAHSCYRQMFYGCTALTTAPELPATTLGDTCYFQMFSGCMTLTTAPELPSTTLTRGCYNGMFKDCTSLTTAPELPATTLTVNCYRSMFSGCTSLTTAPELPASTLEEGCYRTMFQNTTSLNYIKCLATNISATDCTLDWVDGVAASGTFVKNASMSSWTIGNSGIPFGWTTQDIHDYSQDYLTFEALEPTTFTFTENALQYSLDNGSTWTTLTANTASPTVSTGYKILWKQTGLTPIDSYGIGTFSATGNFKAYGNIMSFYYGDNFIGQTNLTGKRYAFALLFYTNTYLIDASNLILPATTLSYRCYDNMFSHCTSLVTAPEIPATTLYDSCYIGMFDGCTLLTTAPELPATTLKDSCYYCMFKNCSSLVTAPELPATTLYNECYFRMFYGCTSLVTAPELPATTLYNRCYYEMFSGCTSLTTPPELPATTFTNRYGSASECYSYMFQGCTSLTTAPELPATTLASSCYSGMFNSCTSLTTAPELPATTLANYCYFRMFYGCTSLNYIKCLATNISATNCTYNWVTNVAASGTFVKNASMSSWTTGNSGIPSNWTQQNAS